MSLFWTKNAVKEVVRRHWCGGPRRLTRESLTPHSQPSSSRHGRRE